jgi:putative aldouronate transport system substrate-binding protein
VKENRLILISVALLLSILLLFTSCVTKPSKEVGDETEKPSEATESPASTETGKLSGKLTMWVKYGGTPPEGYESFNDIPFVQELRRLSGVDVEFIFPPAGQDKEAFNLMIASREFPDIIERSFQGEYPGGPDKALEDRVIIPLDDVIKQYNPNLMQLLKEDPEIEKVIRSAGGILFAFPIIKTDPRLLFTAGPAIRKDWLDELGLPVPETIDEWDVALQAFKDKKEVIPMTGRLTNLFTNGTPFAAWGSPYATYVDDDGKAHFGAIEPGFKEFLALMNRWYKTELLDQNIASIDRKTEVSNMVDGRAGSIYVASASSGVGEYNVAGKKADPKYSVVATKYPVLKKGELPSFAIMGGSSLDYAVITTACKDVELAAKFIDFIYSEEGSRLYNFGVEGKSYEMVDGKPQYITVDGNLSEDIPLYSRRDNRVGIIDGDAYAQTLTIDEARDALSAWSQNIMEKYMIRGYWLSKDESAELVFFILLSRY